MNKSIIFSLLIGAALCVACDPIESRDSIGSVITADQLDITATPVVVNGKNSNKIILENHSPVLSLWDYGLGTSNRSQDEILLVLEGDNKIIFTGLNPDGSKITKEITVKVDELSFDVPEQWALLCGKGEKTWVWDDSAGNMWGNGGYRGNVDPAWWGRTRADITEETAYAGYDGDAYMVFSTQGASLTKSSSDGSKVEKGSFSFDFSDNAKIMYNGGKEVWAQGKLYTKNVTILQGVSQNDGKSPVYEYDVLKLDDNHMVLAYKTRTGDADGKWDEWACEAWFWKFKAK